MEVHWEGEDYTERIHQHAEQDVRGSASFSSATPGIFARSAGEHLRKATLEDVQRAAAQTRHRPLSSHDEDFQPSSNRHYRTDSTGQLELWIHHELAWQRVMAGPKLHPSSVPWPPCTHRMLEFMARVEAHRTAPTTTCPTDQQHVQRHVSTEQLMKRAYQRAVRRWHPDKLRARLAGNDVLHVAPAAPNLLTQQQRQQQQQQQVEEAVQRATDVLLAVQQQWLEACKSF